MRTVKHLISDQFTLEFRLMLHTTVCKLDVPAPFVSGCSRFYRYLAGTTIEDLIASRTREVGIQGIKGTQGIKEIQYSR